MYFVAIFFAGAFLCNCIPHLSCGLRGEPFPTPFSKPRGVGDSPPVVNFLWAFVNFLVGISLLLRNPVSGGLNPGFITLGAGVLAMGTHLSIYFGKVRRNKDAG